jgi:hypothetical protein
MNDTTQSIEEQHSQGLTHQTNLNVVLVKTTHDQDSIDKVNAIQKLLLRHRVDVILPFMNLNVICYTDNAEGLETNFGMTVMPLTKRDDIVNDEFYKLDLFKNGDWSSEDMIVINDINFLPLELCQKFVRLLEAFSRFRLPPDCVVERPHRRAISAPVAGKWTK